MNNRWKKRIAALGMSAMLIMSVGAYNITGYAQEDKPKHGSVDYQVTEDMLSNDIATDYRVNTVTQGRGRDGEYNSFFLKDAIQTIYIEIDQNNLNYMFQNAYAKPTVMADSVSIGGVCVEYVGLKTKGSYTLEHSYSDNSQSDRFSLTINFGKYIKKSDYGEKQNFYGVEKISLNNFFFDKSMMKEYCSLTLMTQMGLPTPQYGLAKLYINGEYYGVYSMIEALDSPILEQYYDCSPKDIGDYLCKPEWTRFVYDELIEDMSPMWEFDEDTYKKVEKSLPVVEEWLRRLKLLSEGKDFEGNKIDVNSEDYLTLLNQIIDVDEYLRYFAAHSFLCQLDNMFVTEKNFGLYIGDDGRSLIIPWDYDLSFGCYSPVTAEATANNPLDLMYIPGWGESTSKQSLKRYYRKYPLFYVIFQNDSLMEQYHTYMLDCSKIMTMGGTTSFGVTYEPNLLVSKIEALREPLTEAAGEKTADRAVYMNGIIQPRDVKNGLNHLEKIIAMRSVGVYSQVNGVSATVSGRGCNLFCIGNGQDNWGLADRGNIISVNADYGFFATAEYMGEAPMLGVMEILPGDERYEAVTKAAGYKGKGYFRSFYIGDVAMKKVNGGYTLSMPLSPELSGRKLKFYQYDDGTLTELEATCTDNIYTVEPDKLGIIVIKEINHSTAIFIGSCAGLILLTVGITFIASRMKRKKVKVEA